MNIININSRIEITHSQKSFIEDILISAKVTSNFIVEDTFFWLSNNIPVFLISENSMKKNEIVREDSYRPNSEQRLNHDQRPSTEWLGFYQRSSMGLFDHTPIIAICPERIASCVQNDEEFMFLLAIVIVHEFAHAKMDSDNENVKYIGKDDFFHWMEESIANELTLNVFSDFTQTYKHSIHSQLNPFRNKSWKDNLFDFVMNFIRRQPPEYALGLEIYQKKYKRYQKILPMWAMWTVRKNLLGEQIGIQKNNRNMDQEKEDWLDYMHKNYQCIDEKISKKLYDGVLK